MTRFSVFVASFLFLAGSAGVSNIAHAAELKAIQHDKSNLTFVYKQMNVPVEGRFKKFAGQLSFDPAKPESAKVVLDIDLMGIDAGSPEANAEVAGKVWFNTAAFPQAKFVSSSFKPLGGNKYAVTGKMTLKGRTQEVTAPFTFTPQGSAGQFDGALVLKRADFAIGEGPWADFGTVANEVQIKFRLLAHTTAK
ncbi:YceI family protein [Propionivibrio limicola]|uniref:YceI family protein n=1 Tax=Propionivibrio limicola TaxID=167645 RepID=UPI0012913325|nr:YceI family protein [Propionivibrio limicola]